MSDSLLVNYDKSNNFWETNRHWLNVKVFKAHYNKDRSQEDGKTTKHRSSREMWALAFLYDADPTNLYRHMPIDKRKKAVAREVLGDPNYDWSQLEHLEDLVEEMCTTPAQRHYATLVEKMNQRDKFLRETEYTLDNYITDDLTGKTRVVKGTADQLEKMLTNSDKIYDALETIRGKIIVEKDRKKGSGNMSETEQGLI